VRIVRSPAELEAAERAVAIGTFDGVHRGHRAAIEAAVGAGLRSTVVTFTPHPRTVLGYEVRLISSLERRIELIEAIGPDELVVLEFTPELASREGEEFIGEVLEPLGARVIAATEDFRFGKGRRGDLALLRAHGLEVAEVAPVEGVSSSRIRELLGEGDVAAAAALLGRPPEVEGRVVSGDQRGGTLGFPTANLSPPPELLVPAHGIYAGAAGIFSPPPAPERGRHHRVALSIGVNPHYGGRERRVEAFLLDFAGDLYGQELRVELWDRLREERAFSSEEELVEQIGRDVEAARAATRPA
jgi:riboflavin kinase / FMN adenylyltransferase